MCQTIPAQIIKLMPGKALVKYFNGQTNEVITAAIPDLKINNWILINANIALQKINKKETAAIIKILNTNKK